MSTTSPVRWIPTFKSSCLFIILLLPHLQNLWTIFLPCSHNCFGCLFWTISNLYVWSRSCNPSLPPIVEHSHIFLTIINLPQLFCTLWKYIIPSRFYKLLPWVIFWPLLLVNNGFNFFSWFPIACAPSSQNCRTWSHMSLLFLIIKTTYAKFFPAE